MVLPKIFFHPTKSAETKPSVARCRGVRGLAVVVARSYHVVLRPVCVRVWPRKSCVATGSGGVDSRSRFPNPRIMVGPPPHPAQRLSPPDDHRRPRPFVTHLTAARERYGATKRSRVCVCVCARARLNANGERRKIAAAGVSFASGRRAHGVYRKCTPRAPPTQAAVELSVARARVVRPFFTVARRKRYSLAVYSIFTPPPPPPPCSAPALTPADRTIRRRQTFYPRVIL
ncbi:hypothetical protein QTP88_019308 [Uroleucon formosanum]